MSLLDDAKKLASTDGSDESGRCIFCGAYPYWPLEEDRDEVPHTPDCASLSIPRILTVLEAAERWAETQAAITDMHQRNVNPSSLDWQPVFDAETLAAKALVASLKGEGVKT